MPASHLQFPIIEEYLRVYPDIADGRIKSIGLFPTRQFRVLTSAIETVIARSVVESNKLVGDNDLSCVSQLLNYHINTGIEKLKGEGKVISAEKALSIISSDMNAAFNNCCVVETYDGYTVFNPGQMPPSPSANYN
jgi:hypothetical protein